MTRALLCISCFYLAGCVIAASRPIEDYTLAYVALQSAKKYEAARYAPGHWHRAESAYQRGERLYDNRDFEDAKLSFLKAREYAEKAENVTRIKRFQQGEAF